jgi:hypothetical protein
MEYDLFISHASEDKNEIARPLADGLLARGYKVWFDEFTLNLGDSLRQSIDKGLICSQFGVVIISPNFLNKGWPGYELNSLVQREMGEGNKVILPVWHNVTRSDVAKYSLALADKIAVTTSFPVEVICDRVAAAVGEPNRINREVEHISSLGWHVIGMEYICPNCGAKGIIDGIEYGDGAGYDEFVCKECGYECCFGS